MMTYKERYEYRSKNRLCVLCGDPAAFLSVRCEGCQKVQIKRNNKQHGAERVKSLTEKREWYKRLAKRNNKQHVAERE